MRDGFALIERREAFAHLSSEPFVMVKVIRNQFAHYFVRAFTFLRSDPVELRLEFRRERDFHAFIVGGLPINSNV